MMLLDAHVHLWDVEHGPLPWLQPGASLEDRYLPQHLDSASAGMIQGAICVQAGTTRAEAAWLVETCRHTKTVLGLVLQYSPARRGWAGTVHPVLVSSPDGFVVGVRVPARRSRADLSDVPGLDTLSAGLLESGKVLECLVRRDQLAAVQRVAARYPDLRLVIDHAGLGADEPDQTWRDGMSALADHENVAVKLSGLYLPAVSSRTDDRPRRVVQYLLALFGPRRLMVGSDWPMSTRIATYDVIIDRTLESLGPLPKEDRVALLDGTARRWYGFAVYPAVDGETDRL